MMLPKSVLLFPQIIVGSCDMHRSRRIDSSDDLVLDPAREVAYPEAGYASPAQVGDCLPPRDRKRAGEKEVPLLAFEPPEPEAANTSISLLLERSG
jgi:hypothetical protein